MSSSSSSKTDLSEDEKTRVLSLIPACEFKGVSFRDITPLLGDYAALKLVCDKLASHFATERIDAVAGLEARGFIFGPVVALALGVGFVPLRKPGKLPGATLQQSYQKEYGPDTIELSVGAVKPKARVLLVDDLLATGGTLVAAAKLIKQADAEPVGCALVVELTFLKGRQLILDDAGVANVHTLIKL
jgi:adenine phosphoribosyltransferase